MTQTDHQNEPKLRFPGFDTAWEEKNLGEFFTFKNGVNADKSAYGKGRKFINVLDIISDTPITYDTIIGSVEISDKEFEKNEVRYGDILFQRSSETREEVGQSNVYLDQERTATFGGFVIRGRPITEIEPEYFHNLLKTARVRKDMTARSGGSTRYNVGQESLSAVPITIAPTLNEQRKIAGFAGAMDAKIAQLERKKALVEDYKKGCMQQLFSQKIRFKDDIGNDFPDWEEKRLGGIVSIKKGHQLNRDDMIEGAEYPVINGGISASGYTDTFNTKGSVITVSEGGNSCGYVDWQPHDFWLGGHCYALPLKDSVSHAGYLLQFLKNAQSGIMALRVGSGLPNIQKRDLEKLPVALPHPDEQRKIADFLSALDRKIDLISQELTHARSFKQGLLQQMFV
ncbi:restriction endonuclease subunit S [Ruegeria sp. 1NDH52C]|uniref:Restriction endonuclease subunit S n=1 Tax=Ruegeria alba TaxID=2916756 RepID=A0ABS9NT00_9RHOB|nr:restriction endonuclease subunit S [Ruegeria alba]MCG6557079.1 restriction endonuclease subunit S [Ruegeria alba]